VLHFRIPTDRGERAEPIYPEDLSHKCVILPMGAMHCRPARVDQHLALPVRSAKRRPLATRKGVVICLRVTRRYRQLFDKRG